ncbi:MAG TPA: 4Fe-4S binding protein [Terracidiphilus sp.]|nr:4Fe-4S binding protein [Terracidiphilus sp.]
MPNVSVITDNCIKDMLCISVCLRKAIHPKQDESGFETVKQLYINPKRCMSCGSCIAVCKSNAIFDFPDLPEDKKQFAEINAAYFRK